MTRRIWIAMFLATALILALPQGATAQYPPEAASTGTLNVSDPTVVPGQTITCSGCGFEPGALVTITFFSSGQVLATTTADSDGCINVQVRIPSDATPGTHTLSATGARAGGGTLTLQRLITVSGAAEAGAGQLPLTGGRMMVALLLSGLLIGSAGLVLRFSARGRTKE